VLDASKRAVLGARLSISNYEAELGRTGGGVVQMTTKSGTNHFHGSAYEFFRSDALNARTFFASTNPVLRYNLFGVSASGPIRKKKTQFFFNYEGRRQITDPTVVQNVPTNVEKSGDVSASSGKITNSTGETFAGNKIPVSQLDPIGLKVTSFYPSPNVAGAQSGRANFVANDPTDTVVDAYVARVDHTFSDNDRLFGRLPAQTDHTTTNSVFPIAGTDSYGNLTHNYYYNASGTWFPNFPPTMINEARYKSLPGGRSKGEQLLEWFNINAFAVPSAYTFGGAGRTFGEAPGAISVDTSLLKHFAIRERFDLQFRAEGLNILNHANFANPDTRQGSPTFGQISSFLAGNQARVLQLGLHCSF
jgi:hypothetical protein